MPVADLSLNRVEKRLGNLEERYESFPVNQTTLGVSADAYERVRERCNGGLADVYVKIYDDTGDVLLVDGDDGWVVPHAEPRSTESLERGTERVLTEQTGVDCRITDLERVTILGVRHDDKERDTVYRLITIFAAERTQGVPDESTEWHSDLPETAVPNH